MSKESILRFFESVSQDKLLQEKLKTANDPESFVQVADKWGYQFTSEEIQAVIESVLEGEMLDEDMRMIIPGGEDGSSNDN